MKENKTNGKATQGVGEQAVKEAVQPAASENTVNEKGQFDEKNLLTEAQPAISVDEKIKRVNELNRLIADRATMKDHLQEIEALQFGEYDEKNTITISNGNTKTTYTMRSTALCKKTTAMWKEEITARIKGVEAQIDF